MVEELIRVFREGKGTGCETRFENGQSLGRILNQGEGVFLDKQFLSVEDAKAFCKSELEKDVSLVFDIMRGDDILHTIMNLAYHEAREKRRNRNYAILSTAAVMLLALIVSVTVMPFQTITGHLVFITGMTLLYVFLLSIMGTGNIEGAVAMVIILVLVVLLAPQLTKHLKSNQEIGRSVTSAGASGTISQPFYRVIA
jgi:hypothetical protein